MSKEDEIFQAWKDAVAGEEAKNGELPEERENALNRSRMMDELSKICCHLSCHEVCKAANGPHRPIFVD